MLVIARRWRSPPGAPFIDRADPGPNQSVSQPRTDNSRSANRPKLRLAKSPVAARTTDRPAAQSDQIPMPPKPPAEPNLDLGATPQMRGPGNDARTPRLEQAGSTRKTGPSSETKRLMAEPKSYLATISRGSLEPALVIVPALSPNPCHPRGQGRKPARS